MQQLENDIDVVQESLLKANTQLEENNKALQNVSRAVSKSSLLSLFEIDKTDHCNVCRRAVDRSQLNIHPIHIHSTNISASSILSQCSLNDK